MDSSNVFDENVLIECPNCPHVLGFIGKTNKNYKCTSCCRFVHYCSSLCRISSIPMGNCNECLKQNMEEICNKENQRLNGCPACKTQAIHTQKQLSDGGSKCCDSCGVIYHYCMGKAKYCFGSPGPMFCAHCKKWRETERKKQRENILNDLNIANIEDKYGTEKCPLCKTQTQTFEHNEQSVAVNSSPSAIVKRCGKCGVYYHNCSHFNGGYVYEKNIANCLCGQNQKN